MASSNLIKQLQERGLVAQVTDEEALAERLAQGPIALYCGFDPTADSLHLGHLVPSVVPEAFPAQPATNRWRWWGARRASSAIRASKRLNVS
jgi:hypothetical protein